MPTIHDNRRAALQRLIDAHNGPDRRGGASVVSKRSGVAASTISQIALGLAVHPASNEKRRLGAVHQMGDAVARKIEFAFGMPAGAMDRASGWREPTNLTAAQRNMLITLEALMRSGCMTDAECHEELDRLRRTYPESADGFSVHVLMAGDHAIGVARPQ